LELKQKKIIYSENSKLRSKLNETINVNDKVISENDRLKEEIEKLRKENERLKRELDLKVIQINEDSTNSNWSSSHNRPWLKSKKRIYSSRVKSERSVGGQLGHKGHFGKLCLNPDEIITHLNELPPKNGSVDIKNNKVIMQVKEIEFKTKIIQHEYTFNDGTCVNGLRLLPNAYAYGNSIKSFII
jgi:hypothetical protein